MSTDPEARPHPQKRLDRHDDRITNLERWKERVMGGLIVLSFLVGSGVFTTLVFSFIGF